MKSKRDCRDSMTYLRKVALHTSDTMLSETHGEGTNQQLMPVLATEAHVDRPLTVDTLT